jgi:hypothetical protein
VLFAVPLLFGSVLVVAARADDCAPVLAAQIAQTKVPYKATSVMSQPGRPDDERIMIIVGGKMYFQVNGPWQSMPYTAEETIARINRVAKENPPICTKVATEIVDGDATTIYSGHNARQPEILDSRMWISDHSGLPMRAEVHFAGGRSMVTTFDYSDVTPPPGVR